MYCDVELVRKVAGGNCNGSAGTLYPFAVGETHGQGNEVLVGIIPETRGKSNTANIITVATREGM